MSKEIFELKWANIFVRYINMRFEWDYSAYSPKKEIISESYPDVDAILTSKGGRENLFLQLTQDIEFESIFYKDLRTGIKLPLFNTNEVDRAITKKEQKYKNQGKNVSNVILLIQGNMIPREAEENINVSSIYKKCI